MPKKIQANVSTLLDLKAELFRKKEDFSRLKQATVDHGMFVHGKPLLAEQRRQLSKSKKEPKKTTKLVTVLDDEQQAEHNRLLELSRQKLCAKAALYDKLNSSKSSEMMEDADSGQFLVNFERKAYDRDRSDSDFSFESDGGNSEDNGDDEHATTSSGLIEAAEKPEEEWVEYTDSLGRTRRCMRKDLDHFMAVDADFQKRDEQTPSTSMQTKTESRAYSDVQHGNRNERPELVEDKPVGPTHYQHVLRNEAWDHGVAYFQFSTDETVRQEQMKKLQMLRHQTEELRLKTEQIKQRRKQAMEKRLQKVIERKNLNVPAGRSITYSYYRNSVGVMIVYDITRRETFEHVAAWLHEARRNTDQNVCVCQLIGHKSDLESQRQVLYEEGEYFAKYHKMKFIETSAKSGQNVDEAFSMLAREIYARIRSNDLSLVYGWEGIKPGIGDSVMLMNDDSCSDNIGLCSYC
ncbi:unnamed protein product [Soboliphyme baturini]|uniref:Phosducin domain-containing protein n=1 Tax=Soboliphyme baturini TaxID=241478 RepID=A0A183IJ83_9BILA|nr:unnamed protein product [Soboliphyme baturini]